MGKINMQKVLVGGLIAGVVMNVIDWLVYGVWLRSDFEAALQALGKESMMGGSTMALYVVWDFVFGIFRSGFTPRCAPASGPARARRSGPVSRCGSSTACSTRWGRRRWGCSPPGCT